MDGSFAVRKSGLSPFKGPKATIDDETWNEMLDRKRLNLPVLQQVLEPLGEITEKYAALFELKMTSKIEGIEIGLEQVAIEQKRE